MNQATTATTTSPEETRPTSDTLARLGPGCYVKVGMDSGLFWAEITGVSGTKLTGTVQQTFASAEQYGIVSGSELQFEKQLVCGTGCDKYCWC